MTGITVRVLDEDDWPAYRSIRLAALQESPAAFLSTYDEESQHDEAIWRAAMLRARRLLAERDGAPQGVASVSPSQDDEEAADVFGLWVAPEARNTGISWRLVEVAAERATDAGRTHLNYWVSTENGRAIAFATNFGFRVTSQRRTARVPSEEFGDQEICLALPLGSDPGLGSVPNPTGPRLASKPGPG
jgi:GNAT superfamily N-acetyltransferase